MRSFSFFLTISDTKWLVVRSLVGFTPNAHPHVKMVCQSAPRWRQWKAHVRKPLFDLSIRRDTSGPPNGLILSSPLAKPDTVYWPDKSNSIADLPWFNFEWKILYWLAQAKHVINIMRGTLFEFSCPCGSAVKLYRASSHVKSKPTVSTKMAPVEDTRTQASVRLVNTQRHLRVTKWSDISSSLTKLPDIPD
jgi:hypothetical protein